MLGDQNLKTSKCRRSDSLTNNKQMKGPEFAVTRYQVNIGFTYLSRSKHDEELGKLIVDDLS